MDFAVLSNDETMLDILAYESASFIDALTGDLFQNDAEYENAIEASFDITPKDSQEGRRSYFASVGKKQFSDSIDKDSSVKQKFMFHLKAIALKCLTSVINAFKAIGEILRKVLQTVLIPLNAIIKTVKGDPDLRVAVFTKEEQNVFNRLKRDAQLKVADVCHDGLHVLSKHLDIAFNLARAAGDFVSEEFSHGVEHNMRGLSKDKYNKIEATYQSLRDKFNKTKDEYNSRLVDMREAKGKIEDAAIAGIKNKYYRKVLLTYMTVNSNECEYAIRKTKSLAQESTRMVDLCTRLKNTATASNKDLTPTVHKYAKLYLDVSTLCNDMIQYFNSFIGNFNIVSKVKSTGVDNRS